MNIRFLLPVALILAAVTGADAQSSRTWVSGVGNDANEDNTPNTVCSRTLPCRTLQHAHNQTAAGGEINLIDAAGAGSVTISKSITIDATGAFGSILASGTNGIIVNAGASDVVTIRGLSINGANTGINGIRFLNGSALHVHDTVIFGFSGAGIDFRPGVSAALMTTNTSIRRCAGGGIYVRPVAGFAGTAVLEKTRLENNLFGLRVDDGGRVTAHDSVATGNSANGFVIASASAPVQLNLDECVSSNNGQVGAKSVGPAATLRLSNATVMNNATGLESVSAGAIETFGNNHIAGNSPGGDGAATQSKAQQ